MNQGSFSPGGGDSNTNKPPLNPPNTLNTTPIPPSPMGVAGSLFVTTAILLATSKAAVLKKKTVKTPSPGNSQHGNEKCRLWNKQERSPCTLQNQSCKYGRAHKCTICSKPGCKALVHNNASPPVANACDLQTPQDPCPEPSSSTTPPTPGAHSQPTPLLLSMPSLQHLPANYLSI